RRRRVAARVAARGGRPGDARRRPDARLDHALVRLVGPAVRGARAGARAGRRLRAADRLAGARRDPAVDLAPAPGRLLPDAHARRPRQPPARAALPEMTAQLVRFGLVGVTNTLVTLAAYTALVALRVPAPAPAAVRL